MSPTTITAHNAESLGKHEGNNKVRILVPLVPATSDESGNPISNDVIQPITAGESAPCDEAESYQELPAITPRNVVESHHFSHPVKGLSLFSERTRSVVYFLIGHGGIVCYIGETTSLPARIHTHRRQKKFGAVQYITVPPERRIATESVFIAMLKPEMNYREDGRLHLSHFGIDDVRYVVDRFFGGDWTPVADVDALLALSPAKNDWRCRNLHSAAASSRPSRVEGAGR